MMNKSQDIIILCQKPAARLKYVAGFLGSSLGIRFQVTDQPAKGNYVIGYGEQSAPGSFTIPESGLLNETGIRQCIPEIKTDKGVYPFPFKGGYDLPFDIFSAIFYLITRYEEYLPFEPDVHGRFETRESFAYRNGFHEEPVVDQWLMLFRKALSDKFPELEIPRRRFTFLPTMDIDSPWAFKYRRAGRNMAGLAKNILTGDFETARRRINVIFRRGDDPFDVYDFIRKTESDYNFRTTFFFLFNDNGRIDPNHSLRSSEFRQLVNELAKGHDVGIHPSCSSNKDMINLEVEFDRFRSTVGMAPEKSRQHYLLLKFPSTYRRLIEMGIRHDYSMGYTTIPAFRAGTTLPFKFYDLEREEETPLTVHPFSVMDVTLQQYMKLKPGEAIRVVKSLIDKIKSVAGIFTPLWHNESLSDFGPWKGWREVFTAMVREGKAK